MARVDPLVLKAGSILIPFEEIDHVDIADIEEAHVRIVRRDGRALDAYGFDALEAIMAIKPSAMEGKRLRWRKHAWAFHNLVGHPLMQIMAWLGFTKAAIRFHDYTTPTPRSGK